MAKPKTAQPGGQRKERGGTAKQGKPKTFKNPSGAHVLHGNEGDNHLVVLGNLRVILMQDGKYWCAQGLEIDYTAQGKTIEEAKTNFEKGLTRTIHENIRVFGTLEKMLVVAPQEVWQEAYFKRSGTLKEYSSVTFHEIPQHFGKIEFLQAEAA